MDNEEEKQIPLSILLVFTLWILISTYFFSLLSETRNTYESLFIISIATSLIFIGWGLISFKKWAYFTSLIIAFCGACISIIIIPSALFTYNSDQTLGSAALVIVFTCLIPATIYLYKNMNLYYTPKKPVAVQYNNGRQRICTKCFKYIPYDSNICPYCGYKYETYL